VLELFRVPVCPQDLHQICSTKLSCEVMSLSGSSKAIHMVIRMEPVTQRSFSRVWANLRTLEV
jgi:hypothetical protein